MPFVRLKLVEFVSAVLVICESQCLDVICCPFCRYGVILEKFQKKDVDLAGRIRGCVVDSAPVAVPDPQVLMLV